MQLYALTACEKLIDTYINGFGGQLLQVKEGSLGLGVVLLHSAPNKKTIVISEVYLNAWSSGHKIVKYNKVPAKYQKLIDKE